MMKLLDITGVLQEIFAGYQCQDYSNNGLQVEASEQVDKVAFAVDASLQSMEMAAEAGAQLLVVHHGISWGSGFERIAGIDAARFALMFRKGLSLYAMHLPLDAHVKFGNNAVIADKLGLTELSRFYEVRGLEIAVSGLPGNEDTLDSIAERLVGTGVSDKIEVMDNSNGRATRVGILSGQCSDMFEICRSAGVNCLVTGEVLHSSYHSAREHGVSVIAAGHYATETWGVKALMPQLASMGLDTVFLDVPTGL